MTRLVYSLLGLALISLVGCASEKPDANAGKTATTAPSPPGSPPLPPSMQDPDTKLTEREEMSGFSLKTYIGKQPVLLLYAATEDNPSYQKFNEQLATLEADVQRHNLLIIDILEHDRGVARAQIRGGEQLSDQAAADLVDHYGVGSGSFIVALRDKAGKTAAHERTYVEPAELLAKLPQE